MTRVGPAIAAPDPSNLRIRPEADADTEAIEAVIVAAFRDAAHTGHTEQFIVKALRGAGALAISLVATLDRRIVGHVAISPVEISDGTRDWHVLGPLAVLPELQHMRIGSRLVEHALSALAQRGSAGCVVLGDPGYYRRFGFVPLAGLTLPGFPPQYFQARAFGASLPQGSVSCHAAFDATG